LLNLIADFSRRAAARSASGQARDRPRLDRGVVFQDFAQLFPWRTALRQRHVLGGDEGVGKAEREESRAISFAS